MTLREFSDQLDPGAYAGGLSTVHNSDSDEESCAKSREKRCDECRSRVTVGTDGTTEYGHRYGCPERPEGLPVGGHAYSAEGD